MAEGGIRQGREYYMAGSYLDPGRFLSLYEQIRMLTGLEAGSVLEVGIGNGAFRFFAAGLGRSVKTLDHDPALQPDFTASILEPLPFRDREFDAVAAFEVLEHLPLEFLPGVVSELGRVAGKYVMISVPDRRWFLRISLSTNYFRLHRLVSVPRLLKVWKPVDEYQPDRDIHYWHIGDRGVTPSGIERILRDAGLEIAKSFRSRHNPAHHFFLVQPRR